MSELPDNTVRNRDAALSIFVDFLAASFPVALTVNDLGKPETWRLIAPSMLEDFKQWMIERGHPASTVNNRFVHVRGVARRVFGDSDLTIEQMAIVNMPGISHRVGKNITKYRKSKGLPIRIGNKKEKYIDLSPEQCTKLKTFGEDTPQGRRDRLLMCLLLDHGLKPKDICDLRVGNLDVLQWSDDTRNAFQAYIDADDCPTEVGDKLLRASHRSGVLGHAGMTTTGCNMRVKSIGVFLGINGLSPSDCKHYFDNHLATPEMRLWRVERENADLRAENYALRMALKSRKVASPRMSSVFGWSSGDIEGES